MTRRVVITGMGSVNPLANTMPETWAKLLKGESGIGPITRFDTSSFGGFRALIAGEVKNFTPEQFFDPSDLRKIDLFSQFAMVAAKEAFDDSGIGNHGFDPDRFGVIIATGVGGLETTCTQLEVMRTEMAKRVSPHAIPMLMPNANAANVALALGLKGVTFGTVSACAAAGDAMGVSLMMIQSGQADIIGTGGSEACITPIAVAAFGNARALSTKRNADPTKASRPFDIDRDGFVMSEGGAVLIFEELGHALRRGAHIYAEVVGYGARGDAHHITLPAPDGNGGVRTLRAALAMATLNPDQIGYVNAHGTSTPPNDITETMVLKEVFGDHAHKLAISSTKSMTGHLVGAAGAIEAAVTALVLERGVIPPTINLDQPDPKCDLDYVPNQAREVEVEAALSEVLGFGGHNSALILKKWRGN